MLRLLGGWLCASLLGLGGSLRFTCDDTWIDRRSVGTLIDRRGFRLVRCSLEARDDLVLLMDDDTILDERCRFVCLGHLWRRAVAADEVPHNAERDDSQGSTTG